MSPLEPSPSVYVVPGGVLAVSGRALREIATAVLGSGSALRFTARGCSMHPDIQDGDVLTLAPVPRSRIALGVIVAVVGREGRLVVHRVIDRRGESYRVRGDAAWEDDGWFARDEIIGVVTAVERGGHRVTLGGRLSRWVKALRSRRPALRRLWWRLS